MRAVISLGGSVAASPAPKLGFMREFARMLTGVVDRGYRVAVVVGGGRVAREYIKCASELGASQEVCDELGIAVTRMNARLIALALGERAHQRIPRSLEELPEWDRVIVMGGTEPGHTTDAVAAMLAVRLGAEVLVVATDVDGVYSADPKRFPEAVKYARIRAEELEELVGSVHTAGASTIVDPKAVRVIKEHGLRAVVVRGEVERIRAAILGGEHGGTEVVGGA